MIEADEEDEVVLSSGLQDESGEKNKLAQDRNNTRAGGLHVSQYCVKITQLNSLVIVRL